MNISIAKILISIFFAFFCAKRANCSESNDTHNKVILEEMVKLRFCWSYNEHTVLTCSAVKSQLEDVTCIKETDGISCMKLLLKNKADFMVADAEELMVLGMNETDNTKILVTHEMQDLSKEFSPSKTLEMVVVARKEVESFNNKPKKHLCSSGFGWRNYAKYFERSITAQECHPNKTLVENRISSFVQHFESDCVLNVTHYDNKYFNKIIPKYKTLHKKCLKPQTETLTDESNMLDCLFSDKGHIMWARLEDVQRYLEENEEFSDAAENFNFICRNGTKENLTTSTPCVWLTVPWRTIIARREIADEVKTTIPALIGQMFFKQIYVLPLRKRQKVNELYKNTAIHYLDSLHSEYLSLNDVAHCKLRRSIRWCISSDIEARKCDALYKAARTHGIDPLVTCIRESSRERCIESIRIQKSDIYVVKPEEFVKAKRKGLKPVARLVLRDENIENQIAAMVPEKILASLNSVNDLKNRKACFPSYRGAGWDAFIYKMAELTNDTDWYCKDRKMVSQFFSESCVFGLSEKNTTFPSNLYSLCSKLPENEVYKADEKAWNCLEHGADVAFVSYKKETKNGKLPFCFNGAIDSAMFNPEDCFLTRKGETFLMVHQEIQELKEDEIQLMLLEFQRSFGTPYYRYNIFAPFGRFEGIPGVIFPEHTAGIELSDGRSRNKLNLPEILEEVDIQRELCDKINSVH